MVGPAVLTIPNMSPLFDRITSLWSPPHAGVAPDSTAAQPLRVPIVRTSPGCQAALREWDALSRDQNPFLTPTFNLLHAPLMTADGWEPILFGARRGGRLVAALPLCRRGREMTVMGGPQAPRFDLCGDAAALPAVFAAVCADAVWDVLRLPTVPVRSPLLVHLPELAQRSGFRVAIKPGTRTPYFALPGFEERLSSKFRGTLRRNARKLGDVTFERVALYDRAALEAAFALEGAAWKGEAGTSINSDPRTRRFFLGLARVFGARGQLSLVFLRAGGERIATQFSLEAGGTFYLYKPGYDPRHAGAGPGHLLVREAAADAAARGLQEFDFLGKDAEWKLQWSKDVIEHANLEIYRPSLRGQLRWGLNEVALPRARGILREVRGAWQRQRQRRGGPA